jgi:hypothetical protein
MVANSLLAQTRVLSCFGIGKINHRRQYYNKINVRMGMTSLVPIHVRFQASVLIKMAVNLLALEITVLLVCGIYRINNIKNSKYLKIQL